MFEAVAPSTRTSSSVRTFLNMISISIWSQGAMRRARTVVHSFVRFNVGANDHPSVALFSGKEAL